ncbi:hypothetical protein JL721_8343 [Aureococcus anophagefferens]|nr:hypothetical protein JL721_8343 [Aureococcus anophagefferens]
MPILSTLYVFGAHYVACARGVPRRRSREISTGAAAPLALNPTASRPYALQGFALLRPYVMTLFQVVIPVLRRLADVDLPPVGGRWRPRRLFRPAPAPRPRRHPNPAGMHAREIRTHTKAVARLNAFGTDVLRNTNAPPSAKRRPALRRGGALPPRPRSRSREIISWDSLGRITISDPGKLSAEVLINYFRHNNFSSFQRQLNYFGYYKISGKGKLERCVYTNNALRHEGDGTPGVEAPPYEIDALLRLKRKSSREGPAAAAEASASAAKARPAATSRSGRTLERRAPAAGRYGDESPPAAARRGGGGGGAPPPAPGPSAASGPAALAPAYRSDTPDWGASDAALDDLLDAGGGGRGFGAVGEEKWDGSLQRRLPSPGWLAPSPGGDDGGEMRARDADGLMLRRHPPPLAGASPSARRPAPGLSLGYGDFLGHAPARPEVVARPPRPPSPPRPLGGAPPPLPFPGRGASNASSQSYDDFLAGAAVVSRAFAPDTPELGGRPAPAPAPHRTADVGGLDGGDSREAWAEHPIAQSRADLWIGPYPAAPEPF